LNVVLTLAFRSIHSIFLTVLYSWISFSSNRPP